jgi:thiol-disulfide isomerase/thioredoxin
MRFLIAIFFLASTYGSFAQKDTGYNLKFKVTGWKDTTVYLGHYYSEQTYLKDTAKVSAKGEFHFDGKKSLAPGQYFLVMNKIKVLEFLISQTSQQFSLSTDTSDYIKHMKVTGDLDNTLFFQNMAFNAERHKEAEPHIAVLKDSTASEDKKKAAREQFNKVNEKVMAYQKEIIAKHPDLLVTAILKANQPIDIPEPPKKPDVTIDSTFQLKWYRQHFFDNFDLGNEAFLRMPRPIYMEKVNEYLDKLYVPDADTLLKAIEKIIPMAKKNQETYKFLTWNLLIKYQQPEIMGLDAVYVAIYDKYFATGELSYWMNDKLKKQVQEFADRVRKSLIGKTGPNLIMQDANLKPKGLYDIKNRYAILFIFDPDCGHCKQETPKLVEFYKKNKARFDVEIFAVSTDTSMQKMKNFIKEMNTPWITVNGPRTYVGPYQDYYDAPTTPSLFILDNKRKIIGKKIPAENLEDFFVRYEKFHKSQAATKSQ